MKENHNFSSRADNEGGEFLFLSEMRESNQKNNNKSIVKSSKRINFICKATHYVCDGRLEYDFENERIIWTLEGEKTDKFSNYYDKDDSKSQYIVRENNHKFKLVFPLKDIDIMRVEKRSIIDKNKPNDKNNKEILKIQLKKDIEYNIRKEYFFSFFGEDGKRDIEKFFELLKSPMNYYEKQLKSLPLQFEKQISLIINDDYLCKLFKYLLPASFKLERIWFFIESRYPSSININLTENKIQLSRDEELIMWKTFSYNSNRLINSDDYIKNKYLNRKEDWENFLKIQRQENKELFGWFRQGDNNDDKNIKCISCITDSNLNNENKNFINIDNSSSNNNSFNNINENKIKNRNDIKNNSSSSNTKYLDIYEELEKNKNYYDQYETNYLFYNSVPNKNNDSSKNNKIQKIIREINNYSMSKLKLVNYIPYNKLKLNFVKEREIPEQNKEKIKKMEIEEEENIQKMEIEEDQAPHLNHENKNIDIAKKIQEMKEEFENDKNKNKNENDNKSFYDTMKIINKENKNVYYLKQKPEKTINYRISDIIDEFLLLKDLIIYCIFELQYLKNIYPKKEMKRSYIDRYINIIKNVIPEQENILKQKIANSNNKFNDLIENINFSEKILKKEIEHNNLIILNEQNQKK